jgi:hypothetical protein
VSNKRVVTNRPFCQSDQGRKSRSFTCSLLLLALMYGPVGHAAEGKRNGTTTTAVDAFAAWLQQEGSSLSNSSANPPALGAGLELARARQAEMRSLMASDPQAFATRAMPAAEWSQLPAQLQPFVERRVKGRGSFSAFCVFPKPDEPATTTQPIQRSGYVFEAVIDGVRHHAFVYGPWRNQQTVSDAEIDGIVLGDAVVLGDSTTPSQQTKVSQLVTGATPSTTGPNTLLYMIARFSDQSSDPITDATVLSQMGVVSNFWINGSGGKVYIKGLAYPTQVVDIVHITLPQPSSYASTYNNNFAQLLSDARTAASALGYNYANYNLDVVVTTSAGFSYAGISYIGGQGSHWVTPYTTLRTAGHELGHNLGLWHANYWRTDSTQPFGMDSNPGGYVADTVNGEWVEYGHYFSVMSAQYGPEWDDPTKPIYNPAEKVQIGWLSGSQVQYVTASGTYRLFRHDAESTVGTPRAIRIETPATDYTGYGRRYWLQYRYAPWNTAQNWYQNGVEVDVAETSYGSDGSILLDMTPYSNDQSSPFYDASSPPGNWWTIDNNDKMDGALLLGRSYDDNAAGIHVTPVAKGNNGTGEEYLDVVINLGTFSSDRDPVINSFTASATQVTVGQVVNFSVSATDPDGDTLAYCWNFDDAPTWTASGLNSTTASKSWPSPGQYRVVAAVSDMKGGVTTASTIITVGQPANTGEIWGRVVWGGLPVYGARISTTVSSTVSQAWTESDGSYVLTDLPTNATYTVSCAAAGLTFTPQFTNPVSITSGAAYGIDFYANQPLVLGGGNTYIVSGQVTDPVNGAPGVEVRGGGMLATTDSSGNYQLTNFLNGTYPVVPSNAFWTFSPASRSVAISSANSTGNNFSRLASYSISGSLTNIPAANNSPVPTVYLSNGRSVTATKTGPGGNRYWIYTLSNVPGGKYSVTAELSGYSFVPSGFSNPLTVSGTVSGVNFIGSVASIAGAITGRITQYGLPLVGVSISAMQGNSTIGSAVSDSDGWYRVDNLPSGAYTVTPSLSGYTFSPTSISVGSVPSTGNNFAAHGPKTPPSITSVNANPSVVPGVGSTSTLSATASGSGPLTYSWDAAAAAGPVAYTANDSTSAASTTVSFQAPGSYIFRAKVIDTNGFFATQNVSLTVSAGPGAMVVSPYEVQVSGGQTVAFRVDAWDQLGNRITLSPGWSVSGGGTIDNTGLFTALTAGGPFTVTAVSGALSATGSVWVTSSASGIKPAVTWSTPANITYGTPLGPAQLNASSIVAGSFTYSPPAGTVLNAGNSQTLSATFKPTDTNTYVSVATNVAINVLKAAPLLTWTNPSAINYSTPLSSTQLNASASVPGTFAYAPTNGTVLKCGTNTLSVAFSPTDSLDYSSVTGNVAIAVLLVYDGINISDPTQAQLDTDGDGLANLAEYALGTDPHNPADAQTGMTLTLTNTAGNTYLVLRFKRRHDTTAFPLLYVPEVSGDAVNWFSDNSHVTQISVVAFDAQFDWVTVQDTTPVTGTVPRFMRLRVAEN